MYVYTRKTAAFKASLRVKIPNCSPLSAITSTSLKRMFSFTNSSVENFLLINNTSYYTRKADSTPAYIHINLLICSSILPMSTLGHQVRRGASSFHVLFFAHIVYHIHTKSQSYIYILHL